MKPSGKLPATEERKESFASSRYQQAQAWIDQAKDAIEKQNGRLILAVFAGSIAYGRDSESSDIDIRGIYLPSKETYLLCRTPRTMTLEAGDVLFQPLNKFFSLAAAGNPNVLEWLFVKEEHILFCDPVYGKPILEARSRFLSRKMIASFQGFAKGSWKDLQKMRIQNPNPDPGQLYKMNKHASHISRLLIQLKEALEKNEFSTWHPEQTKAFKLENGQAVWQESYLKELKRLEAEIDSLSAMPAGLSDQPDFSFLDSLEMAIAKQWICSKEPAEKKRED